MIVAIGVPSYNGLKAITAFALVAGVQSVREAGHSVALLCRQGPYTHWNREHLVEDALEAKADYLMMIDADMVFPTDGVTRLLSLEKDVVGGFYMMKAQPPVNTIKMGELQENGEFSEAPQDWTPPTEPFRCSAVATGFMLIDMRVIAELERPLFPCVEPLGEDIAFCLKVAEAGFEVWCDATFKLDHIGDFHY